MVAWQAGCPQPIVVIFLHRVSLSLWQSKEVSICGQRLSCVRNAGYHCLHKVLHVQHAATPSRHELICEWGEWQ